MSRKIGSARELPGAGPAYATVARAIQWILDRAPEQPSLGDLARAAGMSVFHLQRVFAAWAGVSPKRFLQFLAKEHAKRALRDSADVLSASLDAGLSGPGRLHDLLVSCEGVTPGEVRTLGAGLRIRFGIAPTPFGEALIGVTSRGICSWRFTDGEGGGGGGGAEAAEAGLAAEWPRAARDRDDGAAREAAETAFAGGRPGDGLHLLLRGTNFQIKVWEALLRIPEGSVASYRRIAGFLGIPEGARAVAGAVARNPIGYLIPCHRVLRESGALGGYRWGLERKAAMLAWEAGRHPERAFTEPGCSTPSRGDRCARLDGQKRK